MPEPARSLLSQIKENVRELRSGPYEWFILAGNRLVIAGLLTVLFAVVLAILMGLNIIIVDSTNQMIYLAQGLFTGTVTLVTIVLAINQLILSQEFRTPGQLQDRIENVMAYRHRVEETTNRDVVPATPTNFLPVLLDGTRVNAQRLGGIVNGHDNDQLTDEVDTLVSTITTNTDTITDRLAQSGEGIFETLEASLETNFSEQLVEARRLQMVYGDELSAPAHDELDELIDSLEQVDIARQYFKSLFIQSELADLSRLLLYVGLPAISGAILMFLIYVGGPSGAVDRDYLPALVLSVVVLSFGPVTILFSFVLRISTVAKRTVAMTPFEMLGQERQSESSADEDG